MNLLGLVLVDQRQALRISGPAVADVIGDVVVDRDVPLEIAIDLLVGITTLEQIRHGWSPLVYFLGNLRCAMRPSYPIRAARINCSAALGFLS